MDTTIVKIRLIADMLCLADMENLLNHSDI